MKHTADPTTTSKADFPLTYFNLYIYVNYAVEMLLQKHHQNKQKVVFKLIKEG